MSRLGQTLATCVFVLGLFAAAARADDWSVVASPNAQVSTDSIPRGVSCSSSVDCTAVGQFPPPGGGSLVAGALRWNGTSWASQTIPNPPVSLNAVSCPSNTHCVAVGSTTSGADEVGAAAVWDGASWTTQALPNPAGVHETFLGGVSCSSDTRCTAVGTYADAGGVQRTLAESWDGVSWTIQSTPNPAGAQYSQLSAVSCRSDNVCRAVGYFESSGGVTTALAERWNGSSWARQSVPLPAAAKFSELAGVACVSSGECMAVGFFGPSTGGEVALSERWDGSAWTAVDVPSPSGAAGTSLYAVSCTSPSECTAVGTDDAAGVPALAERWDGTQWTPQTMVSHGTVETRPESVSCASASFCSAVGWYGNNNGLLIGFAEVWNGVSWSSKALPSTSAIRPSSLSRVSCPLSTACTAVGYSVDTSPKDVTLAERWNGTRWAIQPAARLRGSRGARLRDVSCASTSSCMAVGFFRDLKSVVRPLSEGWNGTSWAVHSPLIPAGSRSTSLLGVSCPAVDGCIAVGSYVDSTGTERTLVEDWNGSAWTIGAAVDPPGALAGRLSAVSCAASTACTAVGTYRTGAGVWTALAEQWNGTKWLQRVVPLGGGEQSSELTAVSCPAPGACMASGSFIDSDGATRALTEQRSGPAWAFRTIPTPDGAQSTRLDDVSCPASTSCTAVGTFRDGSGSDLTLAARWDGTSWALQSTPVLTGALSSELSGVSCAVASRCSAVGFTQPSAGIFRTLAERYPAISG